MPKFATVRQIMLKQKRAVKCPFLGKFLRLAIEKGNGEFVATDEIFNAYCAAVAIWTDGDSTDGQTKYLMKRRAFYMVSLHTHALIRNLRGLLVALCTVSKVHS